MGKINKAYCKKYGKVMSFEEIKIDELFDEIKNELNCATPECPSRITYVRGDHACLRTYRGDNHSKDCDDAFEREAKATRLEKMDSAIVSLSEDDFAKKQLYLLNKYLKKDKKVATTTNTKKRSKPKKTIDVTAGKQEYIQASLGANGSGQTREELQDETGVIVRGPSFPAKELNQISSEDIGSKCGVAVEILSVRKIKSKLYEIDIIQNKVSGTLVLPESFFTTQYVEAETYVESLGEYVSKEKKYPLHALTYCEVERVEEGKMRLSVLDYAWLAVALEKLPLKRLRLVEFHALLGTGVI